MSTLSNSSLGAAGTLRGGLPLNSKVTSILSSSYSDTEFRDALSSLRERGIKNDAETRRRMRSDLQKEVIDGNGEIVTEFGRVAEQLKRIRATLQRLNTSYEHFTEEIAKAHEDAEPAVAEASSLLTQQKAVTRKQQALDALRSHFTMSEDEIAALTYTSESVDGRFFDALAKAKKISKDCEVLLGFENQVLGLDLMEQTSKNIHYGFQKLYKWVQREFRTLDLENPQMNASIRRALRVLAERPALFQNCLDFFAEARERILSDSFTDALTGNASATRDNSTKPIDLIAHDPLRYVGDMLAWVHSATVSEREALEILFVSEGEELAQGFRSTRDNEVWRSVDTEGADHESDFNALRALGELVDRDVAGASRLLRQRVEQVIQSNEEVIPAYKLANLIHFYLVTFQKLLGTESKLSETISSLEVEALRQFRGLVRDHIAALQGEFQQTPSDLGPPPFLQESLKQLEAIMRTFDSSLATTTDRGTKFEDVLNEAFEPFISGCENMAKAIPAPRSAIFIVNCNLASIASLEPFDFTQSRVAQLRKDIDSESDILIDDQYRYFVEQSGLSELLARVSESPQEKPDLSQLSVASQILDDFLPSALMDGMDRLRHLQSSQLIRRITENAASRFCEKFEQLEKAILYADGGEEDGDDAGPHRAALSRTGAEIRVLLS